METRLARISVQNKFCSRCINVIRTKMLEIQNISNVIVYPQDALVVFNFNKANQISEVLNTLTSLGYPPAGDTIQNNASQAPWCECTVHPHPLKNKKRFEFKPETPVNSCVS